MDIARHSQGARGVLAAYLSQVHPVFMLPPIAAAAFGAILAGEVHPLGAMLHVVAIFAAVYTAHIKDGYVDFYHRGEDDDHPLTVTGCRLGLVFASALFFSCLVGLYLVVDIWAVALTLPGWLIGYLHAPQLDTSPVTTTFGYPTGIAIAILGGYYVQVQALTVEAVALAGVFLVLLGGVKIVDDLQDYDWDLANEKYSMGVTLGVPRAHRLALGLMAGALVAVVLLDLVDLIPSGSGLAAGAFIPVLFLARNRDPTVGTMLLIRGSYLFLAVLIAIAWFEPL